MNPKGSTCLITGANSGLGLAAACRMAQLGAHVIMLCRESQKTTDAIRQIQNEVPGASLEPVYCDLSSLSQVRNCIQQVKEKHNRLDVLYNNAAVVKIQRTLTSDGLEMMFQVNYLAPFLLSLSLLELLKNSPSGRIINISAPPQDFMPDLDDLQSEKNYQFFESFFKTKLCLLLFTVEFARRYHEGTVSIFATDPGPGGFRSKLLRELPLTVEDVGDRLVTTPEKAAETITYLAFSEEVKEKSGCLFMGKEQTELPPAWLDVKVAERLWTLSESIIHLK